jgi:hypothetical protein
MAQFEDLRKEEEMVIRERFDAEKAEHEEIDNKIDALCSGASAYVDALFLTLGYHQHSRTWRRKRNG